MKTDANTALTSLALPVPTVDAFFFTLSLTGGYHCIDWDWQCICLGCGTGTMHVLKIKKYRKETERASTHFLEIAFSMVMSSNKLVFSWHAHEPLNSTESTNLSFVSARGIPQCNSLRRGMPVPIPQTYILL